MTEVVDDADKTGAEVVHKNQKSVNTMILFAVIDDLKTGMIVRMKLVEHLCCCVVPLVEIQIEQCSYLHQIELQKS